MQQSLQLSEYRKFLKKKVRVGCFARDKDYGVL